MQRIIKLTYTERVTVEVAVEFPIYREHALDYSTIYTCIDENLRAISINLWHEGLRCEIEVKPEYVFGDSSSDYSLGRGQYASSAEDFYSALAKAQLLLHLR